MLQMESHSTLNETRTRISALRCSVCGSHAIGVNFGAVSCAPCKAFFRRNARRRELLDLPCRHRPLLVTIAENAYIRDRMDRYTQIRRCSSCRLRRCFEVGMREELVRTDEENERFRNLVDLNRRRRRRTLIQRENTQMSQTEISPNSMNNVQLSSEIDWNQLSEVMNTYETHSIQTFLDQQSNEIFKDRVPPVDPLALEHCSNMFTSSLAHSTSTFVRSLTEFQSLPASSQNELCSTNIEPLLLLNLHELNHSCYSEPWQLESYKKVWQLICGEELYVEFERMEILSEKCIISDPLVTRLWLINLFFSQPLQYDCQEHSTSTSLTSSHELLEIQNSYSTVLSKYLLNRYTVNDTVRILSNLTRAFLKMQQVSLHISDQLKTQEKFKTFYINLRQMFTIDPESQRE